VAAIEEAGKLKVRVATSTETSEQAQVEESQSEDAEFQTAVQGTCALDLHSMENASTPNVITFDWSGTLDSLYNS